MKIRTDNLDFLFNCLESECPGKGEKCWGQNHLQDEQDSRDDKDQNSAQNGGAW